MYLIYDDSFTIVDYSDTVMYLKMIPETGIQIFTDNLLEAQKIKSNRTGIIYTIKKDYFMKDAISVLESVDNKYKDQIYCGLTKIDIFAEATTLINDIEDFQKIKQTENKQKFNEYLNANPVEFNGKKYGITLEDQLEINLILSQAQAAVAGTEEEPKVQWHAKNEVNEDMNVSDLLALQAAIKEVVAAPYKKMQEYKAAIFDCNSPKELSEMTFEY